MNEGILKEISNLTEKDYQVIKIMFCKSIEEGFDNQESINNLCEFYKIKKYAIKYAVGENFNIYVKYLKKLIT